jgi:hypothetical protein
MFDSGKFGADQEPQRDRKGLLNRQNRGAWSEPILSHGYHENPCFSVAPLIAGLKELNGPKMR